jgi:hypothetical protein
MVGRRGDLWRKKLLSSYGLLLGAEEICGE